MKAMRQLLFALGFTAAIFDSSVVFSAPIEIRIGSTLPLTGRVAFAGEDTQRGIELAVKDFTSDEVVFTTFFEDNQHEAKQAATTAQKLLEQDKVDVIISMWDMADVVAPLAERKGVLHLSIRWD